MELKRIGWMSLALLLSRCGYQCPPGDLHCKMAASVQPQPQVTYNVTQSDVLECRMMAAQSQSAHSNPRAFLDLEAVGYYNIALQQCLEWKQALHQEGR